MNPTEIVTTLLFIVVGFVILQGLTWGVRRLLKLDNNERELLLQRQLDKLQKEGESQRTEIESLRNQVKIIVQQYEETAAKYVKLNETCDALIKENASLRTEIVNLAGAKEIRSDKILFVVIGSEDIGLTFDLASIRAVRSETGFEIKELINPTPGSFKRELDLARAKKNQVYVHMAIRSDKDGYQLGNQIVDLTWLSSILEDVVVMLVAGADSSYIGEFLGVVPYVLTVEGSIPSRDMASFSRLFWAEIGRGMGPSKALKRALLKSSAEVKERIVSHWTE